MKYHTATDPVTPKISIHHDKAKETPDGTIFAYLYVVSR
jgi:hypothetical protein